MWRHEAFDRIDEALRAQCAPIDEVLKRIMVAYGISPEAMAQEVERLEREEKWLQSARRAAEYMWDFHEKQYKRNLERVRAARAEQPPVNNAQPKR